MEKTTNEIVLRIMMENPKARNDDYLLVAKVYGELINTQLSFDYVCSHHEELDLPAFETITRRRRLLQSKYDFLK